MSCRRAYCGSLGLPALREAVAKTCSVPVDQVAIVPGAQAGLFTALMLLLGMEDGSEVLVGTPCYSTYEPTIELAGGKLVSVPLSPDDRFTLRPQVLWGPDGAQPLALA